MTDQPLRSALYVPGANARAMDKAARLPCDAVIFDLEDAVAPAAKDEARREVITRWESVDYGARRRVVRANGIDTPWGEADLRALAAAGVHTVCLPKVESAAQLEQCVALLREGGAPEDLRVWAMIETPRGVAEVENICGACDQLEALLMGTTDLSTALRLPGGKTPPDRTGLLYALSRCVNAARMHGRLVLDGVCLDIRDPSGFAAECRHGRALGFDGKTLIHPDQVETANEVFGCSEQDLEQARRVIAAWEEAEAEGAGVAVLDGRLVETMHVGEARRVLAQASAVAARAEREN